ncbi:MAG: general secretion pathway protein GspK [Deferribacterales bacterium]
MNNRGSVLISVLIFISFCAMAVIVMYENSMKSYEKTSDDFYDSQSEIYAVSAVKGVEEVIKKDDNAYDYAFDDWAQIPPAKVPYGTVSVYVRPVNAKIDLNTLKLTEDKAYDVFMAACEKIFDDENIKSVSCAEIADYIDTDETTSTGGGEGRTYTFNGSDIHTKNAPLNSLAELKLIMSAEDYPIMKKYFTAGTGEKAININFADAETISALLPELKDSADSIVNYAKSEGFKDVSSVKNAASISESVYMEALPYITVKSALFYIKTTVTLNNRPRFYHALVSKNVNTMRLIRFMAGPDEQFY